jgi:sulfur carrier protein ThiS adenylyltransferase
MNQFESALTRYLKPEQLALIRDKRIAIGGAGGLGSNVAVALVRTGFRHFEIIDRDVVEASNLNRQDYTLKDIGSPKVKALKKRLLGINHDLDMIGYQKEWTETSTEGLFEKSDIVIEAFDQAAWKARFVDHYRTRVPFVVSGNGMAGLLQKSPMTVRKVGNVYIVGDGTTDIADGHPPLAPRVIQCAAKMAEIVLDLTLGQKISSTIDSAVSCLKIGE